MKNSFKLVYTLIKVSITLLSIFGLTRMLMDIVHIHMV